jgi:hypothetical protein
MHLLVIYTKIIVMHVHLNIKKQIYSLLRKMCAVCCVIVKIAYH